MEINVPEPDHEGFVNWVNEAYTENRYSDVFMVTNSLTGGRVTVRSGEHPAYSRFIKDIRPKLHEYGFVISNAHKDSINAPSNLDCCHSITGIPMLWVAAYANGYVCRGGACRHVTADEYCGACALYHGNDDEDDATNDPRMIVP